MAYATSSMSARALVDVEDLLKILLVLAIAWIALQLATAIVGWLISGIIATVVFVVKVGLAVAIVGLIVMWLTDRI